MRRFVVWRTKLQPQGLTSRFVGGFAGKDDEDNESVATDLGGRMFAAFRLRRASERPQRFGSSDDHAHIGPAVPRRGGQSGADGRAESLYGPCSAAGQPFRFAAKSANCRERHWRSGRKSRRKEREPNTRHARTAEQRGGSGSRKSLALSRRPLHGGCPVLPGCPDPPVRNSCVRGEER